MAEIIMPKMGDAMTEGKVVRWYKQPGDVVKKGEPLLEIETDKVNLDLEAEQDGTLGNVAASEGQMVEVGGVRVLNARDVKRQEPQVSGYVLFRYRLEAPDGLVLTPLEDDGSNKRGVGSADEFFRFMQVHIHEDTLYGESTHYRRVALWGAGRER